MSAPGPRMKEDLTRVLLSYAMATILLGASLRASASDPRLAKPHRVTRAFFVSGVLTDASVSRIEENLRKLSGVSSVNGLTSTSGCVRATAIDAFSYNYRVAVVEEGCFDRSQASHAVSLCDMHAKYADVVKLEDALRFVD